MRQVVYENLSFDQLQHNLDTIFGSGYSVSLFTDWQNHRATQVWIKSVVKPGEAANMPPQFYGATSPPRSSTPSPDTTPRPALSSKVSRALGTSACRTSA